MSAIDTVATIAGFTHESPPTAEYGSDGNQAIARNSATRANGQDSAKAQTNRSDAEEWNALSIARVLEKGRVRPR